jgi:hypothetical protein
VTERLTSSFEPRRDPELESTRIAEEIRALLVLPEETAIEYHNLLWQGAEGFSKTFVSPHERNELVRQCSISEWLATARPGAALPSTLVALNSNVVAIDVRPPYLPGRTWLISALSSEPNISTAWKLQSEWLSSIEDTTKQLVHALLQSTPSYALLAGFAETPYTRDEEPLNLYWKQIRMSQIFEKFHLLNSDQHSVLSPVNPLNNAYTRELWRLDEETMNLPQTPDQNKPFTQARRYFAPLVLAAYAEGHPDEVLSSKEIIYVDDSGSAGIVDKDRPSQDYDYIEVASYASDVAKNISSQQVDADALTKHAEEMLLYYAIDSILDPRQSGDFKKWLDSMVSEVVDTVVLDYQQTLKDASWGSLQEHRSDDTLAMALKSPIFAARYDARLWWDTNKYASYQSPSWRELLTKEARLTTQHEMIQQRQQTLGVIEAYAPSNYRVPLRVIISDIPQLEKLDESTISADLRIKAWKTGAIGFVPGYRLTSFDPWSSEYGFTIDPEGDPYAPCLVGLPADTVPQLINELRNIKLIGLVEDMLSFPEATVSDLENLIRKHSEYYLPADISASWETDDALTSDTTRIDSVQSFAGLVRDEKVLVQCTGAAQFMRACLETLFGQGSARQINGYVIDATDVRIRGSRHAQIAFSNEGKQYILDATPSMNLGFGGEYTQPHHGPATEVSDRHNPSLARLDAPAYVNRDIRAITEPITEKPSKEERIADLHERLLTDMRLAHGVSSTKLLYTQLLNLPPSDPVRRSAELFAQFESGSLKADHLASKVEYLSNCADADPATRRKFGLQVYPIAYLQQLASYARVLKHIVEDHGK